MKNTATKENIKRETFRVPEKMLKPVIASPYVDRAKVIDRFNSLLANEFLLFTKTLNYHWNVTGPRFHSIHEFLDTQYHDMLKLVDDLAERVRQIGGNPIGTLNEMKKGSTLLERPGKYPETSTMLADLMSDHESIQIQIRSLLTQIEKEQNDPGSEDFLINLLKQHENMAWMLKSQLN